MTTLREEQKELNNVIKFLEVELKDQQAQGLPEWELTNKKLRQLRRMRL